MRGCVDSWERQRRQQIEERERIELTYTAGPEGLVDVLGRDSGSLDGIELVVDIIHDDGGGVTGVIRRDEVRVRR